MTATMTAKRHAPNVLLTLLEGRSIFELGWFYSLLPLLNRLPKGDGHPVIVFPGFLAGERSTRPMRKFLKKLGYKTYDWGLGRNIRFNEDREALMHNLIESTYKKHGQKISLIGWSLGGVFVREMAKKYPDYIRQVVSLGSPISNPRKSSNALTLFEAINGNPTPKTQERMKTLHNALPVPATSVYTKTDGVVHWQGSIQDEAPQTENIEVPASHIGLGVNPLVMYILADRLSQKDGQWKQFDKSGLKSLVFKSPRKTLSPY